MPGICRPRLSVKVKRTSRGGDRATARVYRLDLFVMPKAYSSKPTLNQCRARICRAGEHIESLEDKLSGFPGSTVRWTAHDSAGNLVVPANEIPAIIPILIGKALYNLRGALDYLVSQCFYLATGRFNSQPKFLIEDSISGWNKHLPHGKKTHTWLGSLSAKHQATFKQLQHRGGRSWQARASYPLRLRQLSGAFRPYRVQLGNACFGSNHVVLFASTPRPLILLHPP
jgi:hypothetical protein